MNRILGKRGLGVLSVSILAGAAVAAGTSSADQGSAKLPPGPGTAKITRASTAGGGPVTKTFSFIGKPGGKTQSLFNIDDFSMNARCSKQGSPIIYAFSTAPAADLFGRIFDGLGRLHIVKNSSFNKGTKGMAVATSSGDFDATGVLLFETSKGKTVTVNYAFDNSTTLSKQKVCTVYGSLIAS
jgi:hypothetical protein